MVRATGGRGGGWLEGQGGGVGAGTTGAGAGCTDRICEMTLAGSAPILSSLFTNATQGTLYLRRKQHVSDNMQRSQVERPWSQPCPSLTAVPGMLTCSSAC